MEIEPVGSSRILRARATGTRFKNQDSGFKGFHIGQELTFLACTLQPVS
jgi:hypothetical protein